MVDIEPGTRRPPITLKACASPSPPAVAAASVQLDAAGDDLLRCGAGLGHPVDSQAYAQGLLQRALTMGMSKTALARRSGISRQTLDNFLAAAAAATVGEPSEAVLPSVRTYVNLGRRLRLHPASLMEGVFNQVVIGTRSHLSLRAPRPHEPADPGHGMAALAAPGARLQATWRLRNEGGRAWSGLRLVCQDWASAPTVLRPDQTSIILPDLGPGAETTVAMGFTAPLRSGTTLSRWLAMDGHGQPGTEPPLGTWLMVHVTTLADTPAFAPPQA
jgi:hypothetical protein